MRNQALISVTIFSILFASFVLIQRELLKSGIHPLYLNTLIYTVSATIFSMYSLIRQPRVFRNISPKGIVLGIISAILASVLGDVLVLYGLQSGSPITWSIFVGLVPLMTYLLAVLFLSERFLGRKLIAICFSIAGTVLMLYRPGSGIDLAHGTAFFAIAVAVFAVANITSERTLAHLSTQQFTLLRLITATVLLWVLFVIFRPAMSPIMWPFIVTNGTILVIAIELVNRIMQQTSASFFSVAGNMGTLFVILFSVVFTNEWPTLLQAGGGAVIVASIFLFQFKAQQLVRMFVKPLG